MRLRKENDEMNEQELLLTAQISDALAHPVRLKLFRTVYLANKNREALCNKDLVERFGYAQATISQHMKKLVDSGLVQVTKRDRFSYYYVNVGLLGQYLNAVKKFE